MKLPLSWLQEFIKTNTSAEKIAEALTLSGSEVEMIHQKSKDELKQFDKVVIGQILEIKKHPNADKLQLTLVDIGKQKLSIVCGAPNIAVGQKVPVALVGAQLPNGMEIKKAAIRGTESNGMLCNAKELGLTDDHTGIYILGSDIKVGTPLIKALNLDEVVLDLDITPNRGDCLSIRGLAREVSAVLNHKPLPHPKFLLELPDIDLKTKAQKGDFEISVQVKDSRACPKYSARAVYGIKVTESPQWLKNHLLSVGVHPINNIVDVTNYVMIELGQPLHAFDLEKISGKETKSIIVRRAKKGERIVALDDKVYNLNPDILVIADQKNPIALAGIMGGRDSSVSKDTINIVLEAAQFEPAIVRRGSKLLSLKSDSSYRFERGIDPMRVEQALGRAVELIEEVAGGNRDPKLIMVGKVVKPRSIHSSAKFISERLGKKASSKEIKQILTALGFSGYRIHDTRFKTQVPSWRNDVNIPEDLVEEVGRMTGYGNITPTLPEGAPKPTENRELSNLEKIRNAMVGAGFHEVMTYSFYSKQYAELVADAFYEAHYQIENPINPEQEYLRTSLLPRLWEAAEKNARDMQSIRLFEIGRVFLKWKGDLPQEEKKLSIISIQPKINAFENLRFVKAVMEIILAQLQINSERMKWNQQGYGTEITILIDDQKIGTCDVANSKVRKVFKIPPSSMFAEINLSTLLKLPLSPRQYKQINPFPASRRDLSLIVGQKEKYNNLISAMKQTSSLLSSIELFDYFDDEKTVGKNKKSMAFHLEFQSPDRTLKNTEVDDEMNRICAHLESFFQAIIRK